MPEVPQDDKLEPTSFDELRIRDEARRVGAEATANATDFLAGMDVTTESLVRSVHRAALQAEEEVLNRYGLTRD